MTGRFELRTEQASKLRLGSKVHFTATGVIVALQADRVYLSDTESLPGEKAVVEVELQDVKVGEPL